LYLILFMPKSLGQIHTVSHEWSHVTYDLSADNRLLLDLPGELTRQLQHMVRMMSSFKVVGVDMAFGPVVGASGISCSMSGQLKYFAPTEGRVKALKNAYTTVRRMMKLSGVLPKDAITYDFRPIIQDPADFENGGDIGNQASIEDNGLATCLISGPAASSNVFGIYNQGIVPRQSVGTVASFEEGFDIGLRTNVASADWTLNEKVFLASSIPNASEEYEVIPFELSYTSSDHSVGPGAGPSTSATWNWRPDPALYLSVLTGQIVIHIEESNALDAAGVPSMDDTQLDVAVHVAGWKSILGSNKKSRRSRKKSHGRKRRSKK